MMNTIFRNILISAAIATTTVAADAQMIKVNGPATLAGTPNIGYEHGLSPHLSVSADVMWLPYLSKKHEEVFRSFQMAGECRYYFKASEHIYDKMATDGMPVYMRCSAISTSVSTAITTWTAVSAVRDGDAPQVSAAAGNTNSTAIGRWT